MNTLSLARARDPIPSVTTRREASGDAVRKNNKVVKKYCSNSATAAVAAAAVAAATAAAAVAATAVAASAAASIIY